MNQITARLGDLRPYTAPSHIILIGNSPPRRCGLATFTADCHDALKACHPGMTIDVYAMDDGTPGLDYPAHVHRIADKDLIAYSAAAQAIETSGAEAIWLQHEFGIFGGTAGGHILHLLERTRLPVVTTLHTVLEQPDPDQERVFRAVLARSAHLIVMAQPGREILERRYGVARDRISVIPHGVPDRPMVRPDRMKPRFGLEGRKVIMTFGLLAPDKGVDRMISAMPAIVERHPEALYMVLGATHPTVIRREGEALRERLQDLAASLGVADNVRFIDEYLELPELLDYLQAADIYVTPYNNPQQVTSGTLSYAVSMGKPVVSTPYMHAREILADGHGMLTPFGDSAAMADAINALLDDDELRAGYAERAYARGRGMVWRKCAERVAGLLGTARTVAIARPRADLSDGMLRPDISAVVRMSDSSGILQHGRFSIPDRNHGYCLDDNARALMLVSVFPDLDPALRHRLTAIYGGFVEHAWNPDRQRFRNFMRYDRAWCEDVGSDDSFGRAVWALGVTARDHPEAQFRDWAAHLLDRCLAPAGALEAPRSRALIMLGAAALAEARGLCGRTSRLLGEMGGELLVALDAARRPDWAWFEAVLAYDNARLPEALLRAGRTLGRADFIACGIETLRWIVDAQTADGGHFRAVGTESFGRAYSRPLPFDQQPLEAQATIDACAVAFAVTEDETWLAHARTAYGWFLGRNDVGVPLATHEDGGCFDGLMPQGVNRNQGAESILALQLSSCAMWALKGPGATVSEGNRSPHKIVSA